MRCRHNWPEAVDWLQNLKKTLESFPGKLRNIASEASDVEERNRRGSKAAASQAELLLDELKNLDVLVSQKQAEKKKDGGWSVKAIVAPRLDSTATKQSVKDLRDLLYAFEKKYGQIEEYQVVLGASTTNCGAQVDVVETLGGDRIPTYGELFVHSIVQCGYYLKHSGRNEPQQVPRVCASRSKKLPGF